MEEMSIFCNKVHQAGQKCDKREAHTKANLHKSNKRHKRQPLSKGPRYEHYTPVKANHTTILEKTFNLEVPIWLPQRKPLRLGLDATKYCRYLHSIGHNTKDYWALKNKIE